MCAGQRISLSALVRNPHKGPNGDISRELEVDEERKVPERTEIQLRKGHRERQSTTESRSDPSA